MDIEKLSLSSLAGRGQVRRPVGAPKGGRVHWLLWHLSSEFLKAYTLKYDYARHNYIFLRYFRRKLYDVFVVVQTSAHYWRFMYGNAKTGRYEHFGARSTRRVAEKMYEIYVDERNIS